MEDTQSQTQPQTTEQTVTQPVQSNTTAPTQPLVPNSPKSSNRTFTIALLVAVLLIIAVIAFMLLTRSSTPTTLNPGPIQTTPALEVSPASTGSAEEQEVEQIDVTDTSPTDFPQLEQEVDSL